MDRSRIAAAFSALAEEFGTPDATIPSAPPPTEAPAPRGRGRPAKQSSAPAPAETTAVAVQATPVAVQATPVAVQATPVAVQAPAEPDPFADPAPVPTATLDEVRKALTDLKAATTQENALSVLKSAGGADNLAALKPEKYGAVVAEALAAARSVQQPLDDDPFAAPAAAPQAPPTKEELKVLCIETQKRTSADTVQKVVMEHGGSGKDPATGTLKANFNALPESQYAAVAAKLKALPSTK